MALVQDRHVPVVQNRWNEAGPPAQVPSVSVVVCHYDQPHDLDRLLAGLATQRGPAELREIIVVDDGSPIIPDVAGHIGSVPVTMLRQPDLGVRPGAARNLGARHSTGEVLVFLDADTIPGTETIARLAALPAVTPDALVVGRRFHVDLDGWDPTALPAFLAGSGAEPEALDDPEWLRDGYARTRDLVDIDDRSYQLVISAVMAVSREFFEEVGGFDETICTYGGEDWDLAWRCYAAGAVLAHEPAAVSFHNGPDWAARVGPDGCKNDERIVLARTVPGPDDALIGPFAPTLVSVRCSGWDPATALAVVADLLMRGGTSTRVALLDAAPAVCAAVAGDSRVRTGPHPDAVLRRSIRHIDVQRPVLVGDGGLRALGQLVEPGGPGRVELTATGGAVGSVTATRAAARADRWAHRFGGGAAAMALLFGTERSELPAPVALIDGPVDLRRWFPR